MTTPQATQGAAAAGPESALAAALEAADALWFALAQAFTYPPLHPADQGEYSHGGPYSRAEAERMVADYRRSIEAAIRESLTALSPSAPTLDAAWQRAERALPEGWELQLLSAPTGSRWRHAAAIPPQGQYRRRIAEGGADMPAAAALNALASKLEGEDPA